MPEIKKLLFPLDFSHQSMRAGRYMESMAGRFQAEIMLLHIVDPAAFPIITQHLEPSCKERLDAFLADDLKQFAVRRVCLTGDPAEEISKMVRFWTPDLVMMPSYGLGFYRPSLLGSVTAKVLQDVNCPVWTSVHAEDAPPLESIGCRRVLAAVDSGERRERVLEWARFFAAEYQSRLEVVQAIPTLRDLGRRNLAYVGLTALLPPGDCNTAVLLEEGEPAQTVVSAAREYAADLLVIGRSGGDEDRHDFPAAYRIIRESPCPVISV